MRLCKKSFSVFNIFVTAIFFLSSCSTGPETAGTPNDNENQTPGGVVWVSPESLKEPIKRVIADACPTFNSEEATLAFISDYADSNLRTIDVDGATLFLYLDGAIEPDIEDEASTNKFYEDWRCTKDTLFVQELRFSNTDFYGKDAPVSVVDCVDKYATNPSDIIITCADANMGVEKIEWESWNTVEASGKGVFYENDCNPDCASGQILQQNAVISLSGIQKDKFGKIIFSEIVIQTDRKQLSGGYMDTYSLYFQE